MHGGAPGSGGPKGRRNGNYKHGRYTAEAIASALRPAKSARRAVPYFLINPLAHCRWS